MKRALSFKIVLLLPFTAILAGCENFDLFKNMSDSLPYVEMQSVEMYHDSVLMIGNVTDEGATHVELCGFCYNTTGSPSMEENQVLLSGTSGEFGALLGDLHRETRYYIRSFAYSSTGYTLSETVTFDVPVAGPPTVPCMLQENMVTIDDIEMDVVSTLAGEPYAYSGNYGIEIICNDVSLKKIDLDFLEKPVNGIYTTCSDYDLYSGGKQVYAEAKMGTYGHTIDYGGLVYVTELENGDYEIVFCTLYVDIWKEYLLTGRAVVNVELSQQSAVGSQ
jgi:hypothetical protein